MISVEDIDIYVSSQKDSILNNYNELLKEHNNEGALKQLYAALKFKKASILMTFFRQAKNQIIAFAKGNTRFNKEAFEASLTQGTQLFRQQIAEEENTLLKDFLKKAFKPTEV
ncbi:hypothetical protein K9M16_00290 [Candidatus Babeliales bacterium]|nr:hypothetical protein [Candidatus Babeliales bacterium]